MSAARDWTSIALDAGGRSLIEASAGTGKTWTISVLYLRLLLEYGLGPAQIIVTTFTDAAAQELRERVRARIDWALGMTADGERRADAPAGAWLLARWSGGREPERARRADRDRLLLARAELDRAPIGTLHSLCRRVLADFPFESGSTFEFGEPVAPEAIQRELIDDLWRELTQGAAPLSDGDEAWRAAGRPKLDAYLRAVLAPGVGVATIDTSALAQLMRKDNARMLCAWLDTAQFKRIDSRLRTQLFALAQAIADGDPAGVSAGDLQGALDQPLDRQLKPATIGDPQTPAVLAFARHAAHVLDAVADLPRARALARYRELLRARCGARLAARGQMTFDELIERVFRGLQGSAGALLADRLFQSWPVALVDEFQDTDLQQYAILDRIYRDGGGAARGRLVMIGDPKQAIYRFRGGDIDAYLRARATSDSTLALTVNHRSSRRFVRALNGFYAAAGAALSSDPAHPIRHVAVGDGGKLDALPYRVDGVECEHPLQFHYWDGAAVPDGAEERVAAALDACANHVVTLLSGGHAIGARAVEPGNIAVLVPTRAQVLQLRAALRARAVPCVSTAWSSVFDSPWARDLRIALYAALHPRDEGAVRAALATRLGNRTFYDLRDERGAAAAERDTAAFEAYGELWRRRGVLALVRALVADASSGLFAGADGERALTDLRHLGELLQARSDEIAGNEELLTWFADECERTIPEAAEATADERQQRIETDAERVRLMTLHGAKGLEFDIVLLPLMWANRQFARDEIAIVNDDAGRERCVRFGTQALQRYRRDGQDERFRLLYVALTRARYACHVYALSPARKKADADPERAPLDCVVERLLGGAAAPPEIDGVLWSSGRWRWPRADYRPAHPHAADAARVRALPRSLPFEATWSFSTLANGEAAIALAESAAADEVAATPALPADDEPAPDAADDAEHAGLAQLAPIAGADFGNAVHAMLERRAIGRPMAAQHALIERCLREHGVGLRGVALDFLVPHLAARLQATLDAPLLSGAGAPTLATLGAHAVSREMPFEFALGEVSLRRLRAACPFLPPNAQPALRGMMTGQIDLVFEHDGRFHVLDYKTNRLGDGLHLRGYDGPALARAMDAGHYRFQALLYTVALDRYLRERVAGYRRERHLGDAIYLFVRAVGIEPQRAPRAGIWSERFDAALIDAVDAALGAAAEDAA